MGGAVCWSGANSILTNSIFSNNTASKRGGSINWFINGSMTSCSFVNGNSVNSNGIYAPYNLNIAGGKGIVYIFANTTLSGTSIIVLNNETYYYPPNTNINLADKFNK